MSSLLEALEVDIDSGSITVVQLEIVCGQLGEYAIASAAPASSSNSQLTRPALR